MRFFSVLPGLALGALAVAAQAEEFNNKSIVALAQAGVDDGVVLAKIDSLPCAYKVGTEDIIQLKNAGVTNRVISAMVQRCVGSSRAQGADDSSSDPLVKRRSGIYLWNAASIESKLKLIRPTNAGGVRVTGNGSLVFPFVAKLSVPQPSAQAIVPSLTPTFYFYFEASDNKTGDFGTSETYSAQSPSEFSMVRLKTDKGVREIIIGRTNGFGTSIGIDPKNTIPFVVNEVGDGIFKVEVTAPLKPGEYAFVIRAGSDKYRLYDFRVN